MKLAIPAPLPVLLPALLIVTACSAPPPADLGQPNPPAPIPPADVLLRDLQRAECDPATVSRLARMGHAVVPELISILADSLAPRADGQAGAADSSIAPSPARLRCLAVLAQMGDEAKAALPILSSLSQNADPSWLLDVQQSLSYLAMGCDLDARTRSLLENASRIHPAERSDDPAGLRSVGLVAWSNRASKPATAKAIRQQLLRHGELGTPGRRMARRVVNRNKLFDAELACRAATRPSLRDRIAPVRTAIAQALAGYYPADQSSEAEMWREHVTKRNPRYLSTLAWAHLRLSPEDPALAHVHFMQEGSTIQLDSMRALRGLGSKAAPALPWLLSAAKYAEPQLSREAFATLGALGQTALPLRPELEVLARRQDRFRAELAQTTIQDLIRARK